MHIRSEYLEDIYTPERFKTLYNMVLKAVRKEWKAESFEAIAFRGSSGAALAYPICLKLNIPMIHVHKGRHHSGPTVEGMLDANSYAIIDDFVQSGKTLKIIKREIENATLVVGPVCKHVFLYASEESDIEYMQSTFMYAKFHEFALED